MALILPRPLVVFVFALSACGGAAAPQPATPEPPATAAPAEGPPTTAKRFDFLVRADFFAGMRGDSAALERAIDVCETTLAKNPRHAEALVWHGAALVIEAAMAFRDGDGTKGRTLWEQGIDEMNRAVGLEPDNVGTLIPRGAAFLAMSAHVPGAMKKQLLDQGVADYQKVLRIQAPYFDHLPAHARGNLLYGLADGLSRQGKRDQARDTYQRLAHDLPSTAYGQRASAWLESKGQVEPPPCGGCHAR
ncbi:MAG TPA: hypothetical protein VFG83_05415 [Kofleriaceae bacterium]|nr:hypothetical protein [Kofleriaceae bacterium]